MCVVFKILHIPSGNFITAFKTSSMSSETIFYDTDSAMAFLTLLTKRERTYLNGGPIHDYYIGTTSILEMVPFPLIDEFELLPLDRATLSELDQNRIMSLKSLDNRFSNAFEPIQRVFNDIF